MPVLVIAHQKGGSGKTTSSVHILGEIAADDVIDLDIHKGISILNRFRPDEKKREVQTFNETKSLLHYIRTQDEAGRLVYIDCGGFDSDLTRTAVAVADLVIVPANDSPTELIGLATFDQLLDEVGTKMGINIQAHVLMCKTPPTKKHFPEMDELLSECRHLKRLENRLPYRTGRYGFQESLRSGMGITEIKHGRASPAGREVKGLVGEIRALLEVEE
ncbi:ParA family protein [Nissabacter sp. SGAir0207]|uniref:ParA family protein n=1 Tax=Nissabacter sp. SGAir0207 TaxID=2126321 RepID=UPI0010CD5221|nr:ParA family protein [Nissabacter sp. SGAir0207]QCR38933.1 ATPase [Nissabacter sp. SGAir0207]